MVEVVDLQIKYKLTPSMAQALYLMLTNKIVTPAMLEVDKPITTDSKVLAHRIRRRLAGTPIIIHSQRQVGYWLDQASRETILRDLEDAQLCLPLGHGGNGEESPPSLAA
jgi:hypothetical protein